MEVDDRLAGLVDLTWKGVEERPPWQSLVSALRKEFSCSYVGFVLHHPRNSADRYLSTTDADWDTKIWGSQFLPNFLEEHNPFVLMDIVPGEVYTLDQVVDLTEWSKSRVFQDCLHPTGIDDTICIPLKEAGGYLGHLYCSRREDVGPFGEEELNIFRLLAPWLQRGLRLFSLLMRKTIEHDIAEDALRRTGIGAILLGDDQKVLHADFLARKILNSSSGISIRGGLLHIHAREGAARFQSCCDQLRANRGSVRAQRLPRPGHADLRLLIQGATREYSQNGMQSLLVYISDPEINRLEPTEDVIAELFSLTKAEAAVVKLLLQGLSPAEASTRLGMALLTVRTHIKHIFSKTGVTRQTELLSMIMTSPALLCAAEPMPSVTALDERTF